MFHYKKDIVSIWIAADPEKQVLEKYFEEQYRDDDAPINLFARDADVDFYDHDFVEHNWAGGRGLSVEKLLSRNSYGESFAAAGAELARRAGVERAKFAFVMYGIELQPAKWPKSSPVQYLGSVPYTIPCTGPQLRPDDHQRPINESIITPDGKFGLTTSWDAELRLWNLHTGELISMQLDPGTVLDDSNNWVFIASAAPRGEILTYRNNLVFWKPSVTGLKRMRSLKSPHQAGISQAILARSGKRLVTASFDRTLAVWNLPEEKPVLLRGHAGRVYRAAFLPGGKILSGDDEGEFRIWSLRSGQCQSTIAVPGITPHLLCATKDGLRAVACGYKGLCLVDVENAKFLKHLHQGSTLNKAAVTPDEQCIIAACQDGAHTELRIWDLQSGKLRHTLAGHEGEVESLAVSDDSQTVVTVGCDAHIILWNLITGREIARFFDAPAGRAVPASYEPDGYILKTVAINSSGDRVICGEVSGRVRILKLEGKKLVALR